MSSKEEAVQAAAAAVKAQLDVRKQLRAANAAPSLRNEPRELKSDLKKGTAFAKKVRSFTSDQEPSILSELKTYNLKMFIKETANGVGAALYESPKVMKTSDVVSFAQVCGALHLRYDEFLIDALASIKKGFDLTPILAEMEKKFDPTVPAVDTARLRSVVRFLCEWWLTGLLPDAKFIIGIVQRIAMTLEKTKAEGDAAPAAVAPHVTVNALTIVNLIVRTVGIELMGNAQPPLLVVRGHGASTLAWSETENRIVPADETARAVAEEQCNVRRNDSVVQRGDYSSEAERAEFSKRINIVCLHTVQLCEKLKKGVEMKWRQMCEAAELRGDPSQEVKDAFQTMRREVEKLYVLAEALLSSVGREKELPGELDLVAALQKSHVDSQLTFTSAATDFFTVKVAETMNYYDDDEQRTFYEELPNIDALIPPMDDEGKGIPATYQQMQRRGGGSDNMSMTDEADGAALDGMTRGSGALNPAYRKVMDYTKIDELLVSVHRCSSVITTDAWVTEFLTEATKYFRIEPVKTSQARNFFLNCKMMLLVELRYEPDRAQELIPYLARVAAIMSSRFPEMGEMLAATLENYVQNAVRSHKANTYHAKMLNTRYLCELMKYRICPPIRVIRILHLSIENFDQEHCVMMCSVILNHGISFLLRGGVTKSKAEECLQKMKQAAAAKGVPTAAETEYEHAWAELRRVMNPSRARKVYARVRTPLENYLCHLLFTRLQDADESYMHVREKILSLPWNGCYPPTIPITPEEARENNAMMIRVFRKAHKMGYERIYLLVELIVDVTKVYGSACLLQPVVDHVLESLRRDVEGDAHLRSMQKRLQDVKFLAELYNYRLIPFRVISFVVQLLLLYFPNGRASRHDYSRLRCALQMIRLSSPYFLKTGKASMKQATRKLLALLFVHLHALHKPLPLDLDYSLEETLIEVSKVYDDDLRRRERQQHKKKHRNKDALFDEEPEERYFFVEIFPKTPKAAIDYLSQVGCESVQEGNAFMDDMAKALESAQHQRCFPVLEMQRGSAIGVSTECELTSGPRVTPKESKRNRDKSEDAPLHTSTHRASHQRSNETNDGSDSDEEESTSSGSSRSSNSSGSSGSSASGSDDDEDEGSSDSDSGSSSSSSSGSSSGSSNDDEEDEEEEDSSSSSDEEEEEFTADRFAPKLGPLANAHLLNYRSAPHTQGQRGTTNEEDVEFDTMFREVVKESSAEGAKRSSNKTVQQLEKLVESRMTSISSTSAASAKQQATETDSAIRLLASHQRLQSEMATTTKKSKTTADAEGAETPASPAAAVRVTVLRRANPAQSSQSSQSTTSKPVEGRSMYIPMDSEFAQRSQAFVEQTQRDRVLVQERTRMMIRQHEEEEARLHWPIRGGRGGGRGGR